MNRWLDGLSVAALLFAGFVYSLAALGPKSLRKRMFGSVAGALARLPAAFGLRGWAFRLAAASQTKGSCGGCSSCATADAADTASTPPEVHIPASSIGKRR